MGKYDLDCSESLAAAIVHIGAAVFCYWCLRRRSCEIRRTGSMKKNVDLPMNGVMSERTVQIKFQRRISYNADLVFKYPGSKYAVDNETAWYTNASLEDSIRSFMAPFIRLENEIIVLRNVHANISSCHLARADVKLGIRSYDSSCSTKPDVKYLNNMLCQGAAWNQPTPPSKLDYMSWRDESTTTKRYGFRITYLQHPFFSDDSNNVESIIFGRDPETDYTDQMVYENLSRFFRNPNPDDLMGNTRTRVLSEVRRNTVSLLQALRSSPVFNSVNIIGSSLYFGFDFHAGNKVFVRWIDFSHVEGLCEHGKYDGVLSGLENFLAFLPNTNKHLSS